MAPGSRGRRRRVRSACAVLLALGILFTGGGMEASADRVLRVVATTTQVADFTRIVAGKTAGVDAILSANVDPRDYDPVPSDLTKIAFADIIVENGAGLEDAWMAKLLARKRPWTRIVDASRGVALRPGSKESPKGDPHIWFSVPNVAKMVANIRDALAAADPAFAEHYRANAAKYAGDLEALDKHIFRQIGTLPRAQRKLVTNQDAFGYYAARYGLTLVGGVIPSAAGATQVSAQHLADLIAQIRAQHVKAVFVESSVDPKLAQRITRETGVRIVTGLYGDTLGLPGSDGDTYLGMMRHNTHLIVSSLR